MTLHSPRGGHRSARVRAELVGRDDVLALADRRWAEAVAGDGQLLLIAGEAGIGKSRIIDEIAARLPEVRVFTTRAWPKDTEFPGAVLFDLARALRQDGRTDIAEAITARIRDDETGGDAARRHRMLVADLADLVIDLLTGEPTLLRIEDLHWADELSLDVLERVAPLIHRIPTLVLGTYRSDELRPGAALSVWRSRVLGQRFAEEAPLARLDRGGTARLVETLLGEVPSVTQLDELLERSNGIPLYLEELVAAGGAQLVPETIAEAVRQRAALLPADVRVLAEAAAVIGCSFEFDLFADIVDAPAPAIDEGLRSLCDEHLLVRLSATKFDYRHALLRDALYEDVPLTRRRMLHAEVARASEHAGLRRSYLAEQYELAQLPELAHPHAVAAARAAARISAHREAADLFARAVRTAPADLPPGELAELTAARARELAAVDEVSAAGVLFREAIDAHLDIGRPEAAALLVPDLMAARHLLGDDLEQRIALAREARRWLAEAPGGGTDLAWGRLLAAEAAAYMLARRLDASIESGEAALARLAEHPDAEVRLDVQATLGAVQVFAGRTEGWELLESVIREAGTEHEAAAVRARRMLATSASVLVEYDRARRWLDEGLDFTATAERWNDHHYLRAHRAHVRWATGEAGAERDARRALADGHGITTQIEAHKALGYVLLAHDRLADARAELECSLELAQGMAELQRISPALWGLAELALHEKRLEDAVALCEQGLRESGAVDDAAYLFPFVLTGARARLALRDPDGARAWLDRCADAIRGRGIPRERSSPSTTPRACSSSRRPAPAPPAPSSRRQPTAGCRAGACGRACRRCSISPGARRAPAGPARRRASWPTPGVAPRKRVAGCSCDSPTRRASMRARMPLPARSPRASSRWPSSSPKARPTARSPSGSSSRRRPSRRTSSTSSRSSAPRGARRSRAGSRGSTADRRLSAEARVGSALPFGATSISPTARSPGPRSRARGARPCRRARPCSPDGCRP